MLEKRQKSEGMKSPEDFWRFVMFELLWWKCNKILRKYKVLIVNRDSRCYNINIVFREKVY